MRMNIQIVRWPVIAAMLVAGMLAAALGQVSSPRLERSGTLVEYPLVY